MAATIYSFKDMQGVFAYRGTDSSSNTDAQHSFTFGGTESVGINTITINHATDNTTHDISVDGGLFVLPVLVWNGSVAIECQQTSTMHTFLMSWINSIKAQAKASTPDFTNWANAVMLIQKTSTGGNGKEKHKITGISPQKTADLTYSTRGGVVTWNLLAADIYDD